MPAPLLYQRPEARLVQAGQATGPFGSSPRGLAGKSCALLRQQRRS